MPSRYPPISQLVSDFKKARRELTAYLEQQPNKIGDLATKNVRSNIDLATDSVGSTWPQRSKATYLIYERQDSSMNNRPLLNQSGKLRRSVRKYEVTKKSVFIGISLLSNPQARLLDRGGQFKMFGKHTANMPQREYMYLSDNFQDIVYKSWDRGISRILKKYKK